MNPTDRLAELLMRFPGIGPKQAKRFVYFLLREHSSYKEQLIKALDELKFTGKQCKKCFSHLLHSLVYRVVTLCLEAPALLGSVSFTLRGPEPLLRTLSARTPTHTFPTSGLA
jgi:hypothetical protein